MSQQPKTDTAILKIPKINIFDDLLFKLKSPSVFENMLSSQKFHRTCACSTLQLGEGIYQGERKLYLHFVCSLLISVGTQNVLRWQKLLHWFNQKLCLLKWMKKAFRLKGKSGIQSFAFSMCCLQISTVYFENRSLQHSI